MSALTPLGSVTGSALIGAPIRPEALTRPLTPAQAAPANGFGAMLDNLVETVATKETAANDLTRRVLLGETDQLHQSVIAMQEASVAFGLMVEVRNKLVESYQELMRLQV